MTSPWEPWVQGAWDPRWRSCLSELSQANVLQVSLQPGALAVPQSRHRDDERTGQGTESEQLLLWERRLKGKELQILKKAPLVFRISHRLCVPYSHLTESQRQSKPAQWGPFEGSLLGGVGVTGRAVQSLLGPEGPCPSLSRIQILRSNLCDLVTLSF